MNTIERLAAIGLHYGVTWQPEPGDLHHFLDRMDTLAGIRTHTTTSCRAPCTCNKQTCRDRLPVGARVTHHEEKIRNPCYHFWLGGDE